MSRQLADSETLVFQGDGNLVRYDNSKAVWASNTNGRDKTFAPQSDGSNVVTYNGKTAFWASHTNGSGSSKYIIQLGSGPEQSVEGLLGRARRAPTGAARPSGSAGPDNGWPSGGGMGARTSGMRR